MTDAGDWFVVPVPRPQARHRLVLLPHAGGGANFYRSWGRLLDASIELQIVQYPGRENRTDEPLIPDMTTLAYAVVEAVEATEHQSTTTSFFGHSMGAALAYEVVRRLEDRRDCPVAERLFVSGQGAPEVSDAPFTRRARPLTDEEILRRVERNGGTHRDVMRNPELRDMFLPTLRNDYTLIKDYTVTSVFPVSCDVTALVGDADPNVSASEVGCWSELTRGDFDSHVMEGGHFYLIDRRSDVVDLLNRMSTRPAMR